MRPLGERVGPARRDAVSAFDHEGGLAKFGAGLRLVDFHEGDVELARRDHAGELLPLGDTHRDVQGGIEIAKSLINGLERGK